MVKSLPTMRETWVRSLGWEDPLEKDMATHSSILAWRIPRMEENGGLQSMGSQRSNQSSVLTPLEIKPCSPNWVRLQCPLHWAQDGSLKGCERTSDLQKKLPLGPTRAPAPGEDFGGCWAGAQRARCPLEAGSHRCWHHARAPGDSQDSFPKPP